MFEFRSLYPQPCCRASNQSVVAPHRFITLPALCLHISHYELNSWTPGRMWKRLNNKDRQPEIAIGSPTIFETTADENSLQGTTNINNGSFSISSRPAFGRKRTEDVLKGLPALPLYVPSSNQNSKLRQKATNCRSLASQIADHYLKHLQHLQSTRNLHRS